jgi:hypothetical protein
MSSTVGDEEHGMTRGCNWVAGGETHPRPAAAPGDESTGRLAGGRGRQDSATWRQRLGFRARALSLSLTKKFNKDSFMAHDCGEEGTCEADPRECLRWRCTRSCSRRSFRTRRSCIGRVHSRAQRSNLRTLVVGSVPTSCVAHCPPHHQRVGRPASHRAHRRTGTAQLSV